MPIFVKQALREILEALREKTSLAQPKYPELDDFELFSRKVGTVLARKVYRPCLFGGRPFKRRGTWASLPSFLVLRDGESRANLLDSHLFLLSYGRQLSWPAD